MKEIQLSVFKKGEAIWHTFNSHGKGNKKKEQIIPSLKLHLGQWKYKGDHDMVQSSGNLRSSCLNENGNK